MFRNPLETDEITAFSALDVVYPLMVVGTAERQIQIFNLNQPTQAFKTLTSPLRWQTRTVRPPSRSWWCDMWPIELTSLDPVVLLDCLLPGRNWLRNRNCRGTSGDPVSLRVHSPAIHAMD